MWLQAFHTPAEQHPSRPLHVIQCIHEERSARVGRPIRAGTEMGQVVCTEGCPFFAFTSKADKEKHLRVVHLSRKRAHSAGSETSEESRAGKSALECTFRGCGLTFATKYQLHKHKANEGHKFATRVRPKK